MVQRVLVLGKRILSGGYQPASMIFGFEHYFSVTKSCNLILLNKLASTYLIDDVKPDFVDASRTKNAEAAQHSPVIKSSAYITH